MQLILSPVDEMLRHSPGPTNFCVTSYHAGFSDDVRNWSVSTYHYVHVCYDIMS